ncbi:aminotransferase class I/II-fold pyridoxal phosphate-dependent enzyme [Paenibacillus sp. J2TS4]|uniref:aminotransferase class I/II-fold pyridoxal phosphate-dependent enzyme n=1 Tax=Paenibacillus sp. J2TS4 TaxID=2807194 RepID=UPI001B23F746|nr:aminotransferase class I/II-fold pyridoxal phosphate-dependent enzyme [Paenibacillus sp. J2TS4]GIP34357.1 aminotransferase [Paenibacillus sp. J2TS4]
MRLRKSARIQQLGSAIFAEMEQWKEEVRQQGMDIIDLGIGSPDLPPSAQVMDAMGKAVADPGNYGYPTSSGGLGFRAAVSRWYEYRFGVNLDPETEVLTLMGSQDGLAHLAMALADPGDMAIVPDPGYPIYHASLVLAGVTPWIMPLRAENDFLPMLDAIPTDIAQRAKFILCNYPSNPLSAVANPEFFEKLVRFAREHELLVVHDIAYSELAFDGYEPTSILQVDGAKEVAVEFHSLSKSYNMAGCRLAYMVGNAETVQALGELKSNIDYGVFEAIQQAGIVALEEDRQGTGPKVAGIYQRRRDVLIHGLRDAGWDIPTPKATMFLWAPIPKGWTSRQISREILYSTGVVVIPGDAFGKEGEGYVRIALVREEEVLKDVVTRLGRFIAEQKTKGRW